MNQAEPNSPVPADLGEQVDALQRQVFTLLLALIIVSGTLVTYLGYESHHLGKQIEDVKPQAMQITQIYMQNESGMNTFVNQLIGYAQTHPDFRPILIKNGFGPAPGATNVPKK